MISHNYIAIADVHIGNPRMSTRELYLKLKRYLYPRLRKKPGDEDKVDVLFVCGDFFDTLLTMNTESSIIAVTIIDDLVALALEYGFLIRVIRGTYTHDRNQCRFFNKRYKDLDVVKVYETMGLEHIESVDKWVMYTPDNLPYENQIEEMEKLLRDNQLSSVDILINHGYLDFMLPEGIPTPKNVLYANVLKEKIIPHGICLSGHVHKAVATASGVISIGSFDCFAHGEEDTKKGYCFIRERDGVFSCEFIVNEDACPFRTIRLKDGTDGTEFVRFQHWYDTLVENKPKLVDQLHIRLISDDASLTEACSQYARTKYEDVVIDKNIISTKEQVIENVNTELDELPVITPGNLGELILPIAQKCHNNVTLQDVASVLTTCDKLLNKEKV